MADATHPLRNLLRHGRDDDEPEDVLQNPEDGHTVGRTGRILAHFGNDAEQIHDERDEQLDEKKEHGLPEERVNCADQVVDVAQLMAPVEQASLDPTRPLMPVHIGDDCIERHGCRGDQASEEDDWTESVHVTGPIQRPPGKPVHLFRVGIGKMLVNLHQYFLPSGSKCVRN